MMQASCQSNLSCHMLCACLRGAREGAALNRFVELPGSRDRVCMGGCTSSHPWCRPAGPNGAASRLSPGSTPRARRSSPHEADLADLKFGHLIGTGSFGRVYKGARQPVHHAGIILEMHTWSGRAAHTPCDPVPGHLLCKS